MDRISKLTTAVFFTIISLIFSYIETLIPLFPAVPGIKLGLSNIVIVIAFYYLDIKSAILINLVRILISSLLFSGIYGLTYSISGAALSMCSMIFIKHFKSFSIVGVSIAGGFAHNVGQLLAAAILISNAHILTYLPILTLAGTISGLIIGIVSAIVLKRVNKIRL